MILNIKRFAPELGEYNPEYSYTYTKKGYVATVEVSIECDYDISSIELSRGETLLGDLVDVTSDWTFYNDGSSIKRTFTEPCHDTFVINFENTTVTGYVIVNTSDDFTPDSEKYPVEINGDVRIANTEMKLKDVVNSLHSIVDIIYPVGSVYISTTTVDPKDLFGGTWEKIATGRTLWGASADSELNTTVNSGLPNITGTYDPRWSDSSGGGIIMATQNNGAMYTSRPSNHGYWWAAVTTSGKAGVNTQYHTRLNFSAKNSNSIYGNSTIVQPPAYKVYMWRRTA